MSQLVRVYQRKSRSPWDDTSTFLLLADIANEKTQELSFGRYIYQHRDAGGRILGISVSRSIQDELECGQYIDANKMQKILSHYCQDISEFCEKFPDEFEAVFGLPPDVYLIIAAACWSQ
ncbi:hypothetical protein WG68_08625 [Arsukibacterium ikkense]|uniref:Uncharacterized protein n=1 Tax=Arsukibacterium ikkense TaxID=336831 RepID=A0A0M2V7Z2_9GAMM|nr:hypothetical protein [Arsukibacterium ikkense]KKO45770.1 hypothetical protein WG68_08625 [Arsukibacterium ikkense]